MAEILPYYRPAAPKPAAHSRAPMVLGVSTLTCFLLPFVFLYAIRYLIRSPSSANGLVIVVFFVLSMVLWLCSWFLALWGAAVGIIIMRREKPHAWTIVATAISATILLFELIAIAAGFLRTLRFG